MARWKPIIQSVALTDSTDVSQNMEITLNSGSEDTSGGFYLSKAFMKQEEKNYYVMKDVDGRLKKTDELEIDIRMLF